MNIQSIAFVCYAVTDVSRARGFYENVLGLKATSEFISPDMAFIEYEIGAEHTLAIGMGAEYFKPGKGGAVAALELEDFDIMVSKLKENSVTLVTDVMDFPSCKMLVLEDPDGNRLMIHKRKLAE
jgi:predicted enzyme related to lactoylglutathione lyase